MDFRAINQIREEFNLNGGDAVEIKKQLRQKQKQIHPDNNAGDFASEKDKETFLKIEDAINFLEKGQTPQTALVPIETVNELLKVIKDLAPKNQETNLETKLETKLSEQISEKIDKRACK